ncbi:MAG: molybdopterin-dependent oxidoreductase [Bacteroidota bacterium]
MEIRRREFLKLIGGASGTLLLSGCGMDDVLEIPANLIEKARRGPKVETWKNTICGLCPGGCGMRVRLIDGIPVSVKGNPVYPVNRGGMCPLGLNALHALYHPDRARGPLRRSGDPGSGRWEPLSWDDALKTISTMLLDLREKGNAHQVAFLGHEERGLMHEHIGRFMRVYGSPNYFQFSSAQNNSVPYSLVHGHSRIPAFDFLNAKLILSFGANFLEEGYSPVYYTKLYSRHRETGTRYIQIDSRANLTASNADRWIPIRPGTYGALALGLAFVLIREESYNMDFVRDHTFGFDNWTDSSGEKHVGFESLVLGNYYPERVSEITGIDSATILALGRELGNTQPALVLGDQGTIDAANGTFASMAVHSLNALLGNFERDGGLSFIDDPPFMKLPEVRLDAKAREGHKRVPIARSNDGTYPLTAFSIDSFTQNVLSQQPYPLSVLFLYGGNPLFETLNHHDFANALKKIPLIVSFDSMVNETSEYAHLVLPDHNAMERWGEISNVASIGFAHVGIQQPVVPPLYDTRHTGDVIIELAARLGGSVKAAFPFSRYEESMKHAIKGVYRSGKGAITTDGVGKSWLEYLQQRGWHVGRYDSFEEFWDRLVEHGGWWDPIHRPNKWNKVFQTPSGRFEFFSQKLKSAVDALVRARGGTSSQQLDLVLNGLMISARGDSAFLPHHEPPAHDAELPLQLITFRVLPTRDGQGANLPMMQEMFGYAVRRYWGSWVEIHPTTAAAYHINDGDWVWVESPVGTLKVRAQLSPGIMPNVVAIPIGLGHTSYGRYARGHGVNPTTIMKDLYDMISGKPALQGTRVRISVAS